MVSLNPAGYVTNLPEPKESIPDFIEVRDLERIHNYYKAHEMKAYRLKGEENG